MICVLQKRDLGHANKHTKGGACKDTGRRWPSTSQETPEAPRISREDVEEIHPHDPQKEPTLLTL